MTLHMKTYILAALTALVLSAPRTAVAGSIRVQGLNIDANTARELSAGGDDRAKLDAAITNEVDPVAMAALAGYATTGELAIATANLEEQDPRALRLYHYGDPDIVITPTNFFGFNPATGTITSYSSSGPIDIVIPYEIGGGPVVAIGDRVFGYDQRVTKITSPRTLTSIGDYAFAGSSLTTLTAPAITSIGNFAFVYSLVTTLTAPALTNIGEYAFQDCSTLTSVYFGSDKPMEGEGIYHGTPANLVNYVTDPTATGWGATFGGRTVVRLDLYADAFHGSGANLTGVTKPVDIADRPTFAQVTNVVDAYTETDPVFAAWLDTNPLNGFLTEEQDLASLRLYHYGDTDIVITPTNFFGFNPATGTITSYSPSGPIDVVIPYEIGGVPVVAIGDNAFQYDQRVTKITSPRTLTNIGHYAFQDSSLTTLTAPALTSIGNHYPFQDSLLTTLTAPALTSIGDYAFQHSSLTTLTAHALTSIGNYAFRNSSLTTLAAPALTSIGDYAFYSCDSLTSITTAANAPTVGSSAFSGTHANLVITVTDPQATGWGATFGGRPVVRLDLHADAVYSGGSLVVTEKTKELHNDSYTNLVWRNVFSNGWVWLVAYTNTPTGGQ